MTYEEYVEKKIFEPLGMTRSMYCNNSENVPRRAYGHGLRNGIKPFVRVIPDRAHGDLRRRRDLLDSGGPDHVAAGAARRQGADAKSYAEMMTPSRLDDGTSLRYSMGLFVGEDSHGLEVHRTRRWRLRLLLADAVVSRRPLAVVVLTNSEPDDTTVVADNLAAAVLPPPPRYGRSRATRHRSSAPTRVPVAAGRWSSRLTQTPQGIAFAIAGAQAGPLPWVEAWTFRQNQSLLTFRRSASEWSGDGTPIRQGRRPLHPEAAVARGFVVWRTETWQRIGFQPGSG